jgi:hypothetical protein
MPVAGLSRDLGLGRLDVDHGLTLGHPLAGWCSQRSTTLSVSAMP